jgi:hypothetical protein
MNLGVRSSLLRRLIRKASRFFQFVYDPLLHDRSHIEIGRCGDKTSGQDVSLKLCQRTAHVGVPASLAISTLQNYGFHGGSVRREDSTCRNCGHLLRGQREKSSRIDQFWLGTRIADLAAGIPAEPRR